MSTNTADLINYHPKTPIRKIEDYADILYATRPHVKSPMPVTSRAAQFSPMLPLLDIKTSLQPKNPMPVKKTISIKKSSLNQIMIT